MSNHMNFNFNPMADNNQFDLLNYLNDMYMVKMADTIDIKHAGGFHNIHTDGQTKVDEEILEINKKRIHIPNAEIKQFSYRQQQDIKEYNETDGNDRDEIEDDTRKRKNGTRTNEVFVEGKQTGGVSIGFTDQEIIEI